jgi:hypothetical protein
MEVSERVSDQGSEELDEFDGRRRVLIEDVLCTHHAVRERRLEESDAQLVSVCFDDRARFNPDPTSHFRLRV